MGSWADRRGGARPLAHGFDTVGIRHAELWIDPGNRQSQRVADKLGARFRGFAITGRLSVIHGITRDEWGGGEGRPMVASVVSSVAVSDIDRAIALWCDGLGFRLSWHVDELAHVVARGRAGPACACASARIERGSSSSSAPTWTRSRPEPRPLGGRSTSHRRTGRGARAARCSAIPTAT